MNTAVAKKFSVKPLVAAVALSVTAGAAYATPPIGAVPGAGMVTAVNAGTTFTTPGGVYQSTTPAGNVKGDQIYNGIGLPFFPFITPGIVINNAAGNARGVIQWGGNAASLETFNAAGFNLGSAVSLTFTANTPAGNSAILNIDGSGSPSFIMGQLVSWDTGTGAPRLYVANANGIIVGANAQIIAPTGIGLLGANLNNATALNDFIGNNSTGVSYIDITDGQAKVEVNGSISGSPPLLPNAPANFVLLAGGDIVNTGNIFGSFVWADAGMRRVASKATVNGVANTVVNRLWDVDNSFLPGGTSFDAGVAGGLEIASASSDVNTGSISVDSAGFGWFINSSANGFRSGTQGSTDPALGIFADLGVFLFNYSAGSKVEVYNSVKGYSLNKVLPFFQINADGLIATVGGKGDVIIDALTVGTLPSSITTTGGVAIFGDNVTVNSTINHKLNSAGGVNTGNLEIGGAKSVAINKSIGAGGNVFIHGKGNISTAVGANILSDTDKAGGGGILIQNDSTSGASTTTIAGNLDTSSVSGSDIQVIHNGISTAKVVISGNVTTHAGGDILVWSDGNLDLSGTFTGSDDVSIVALGQSSLLRGPITADVDGPGNGFIAYAAPFAQTKVYPAAVLTAPQIYLGWADNNPTNPAAIGGWVGTNTITGVNASGATYANKGEKPAVQMATNNLVALLFGNLNAPIVGVTDWLQNQMQINPQDPTVPLAISLSVIGAGPQYVNIGTTGDVWIDSGVTQTPFFAVGLTSGTAFPVGPLVGNGNSSLIVNAAGALSVVSNSGAQGASWPGGPGFHTGPFGNAFFEFPGGVAMKSGDLLTTFVPMYNAWTELAFPYQGFWFEAPKIDLLSYFATQGNARVNVSTIPLGAMPNIYVIERISPDSYGFRLALDRGFLNTYSKAITGTPINNCPIGFVC